jgi:hypothetical protein
MAVSDDSNSQPPPQQRRSLHFRYFGAIFLSWIGPGGKNYAMGRSFDISEHGLGVEIAIRISVDSVVTVRAEWAQLDNTAIVRRIVPRGGVFQLGLELKQPLAPEVLAQLVDPNSD